MDTVLFIDDEPNILSAMQRLLADQDFRLLTAKDALEGLNLLSREEVAVLITDNMMPGMSGLDMLRIARQISPRTVRVMLTGYASLKTAIAAINLGEVYRFLVKPWENDEIIEVLTEARQRYRIVQQLERGDEAVMLSIARTIELKDAYTRGHCERVADYACVLGEALAMSADEIRDIKYGGWLHDCGKIGIPETILNKAGSLSDDEFDTVKNHCLWGAEVARQASLPPRVTGIILHHHEKFMGGGYPSGLRGAEIPIEARIVAIADVFDALTSDRPYRKAYPIAEAKSILSSLRGSHLDPDLTEIFCNLIDSWRKVDLSGKETLCATRS